MACVTALKPAKPARLIAEFAHRRAETIRAIPAKPVRTANMTAEVVRLRAAIMRAKVVKRVRAARKIAARVRLFVVILFVTALKLAVRVRVIVARVRRVVGRSRKHLTAIRARHRKHCCHVDLTMWRHIERILRNPMATTRREVTAHFTRIMGPIVRHIPRCTRFQPRIAVTELILTNRFSSVKIT